MIAVFIIIVAIIYRSSTESCSYKPLLEILRGKKILAFGDSLTEGMGSGTFDLVKNKMIFHPFTMSLQKLISDDGYNVFVNNTGISGDMTASMNSRIVHDVFDSSASFIIILGGTNDLIRLESPLHLLGRIILLHRLALTVRDGRPNFPLYPVIGTLVITIPPVRGLDFRRSDVREMEENRKLINKGIIKYAEKCLNFPVLDLSEVFSLKNESLYLAHDDLHFSDLGYDKLGRMMYDFLKFSVITDCSGYLDAPLQYLPSHRH